jgi:hypothetical protein
VSLIGKLRDHEIEVRVALTVRMGRLVDGHAIHVGLEIGAVIQIVAAHQVLIRLTLPAMQGHDQARHGFQAAGPGGIAGVELQLLVIATIPSLALAAVPSSSRRSAVTVISCNDPRSRLVVSVAVAASD